jgi:hypothetical protein
MRARSIRADIESPGSGADVAASGPSRPGTTAACAAFTPAGPQPDSVMARAATVAAQPATTGAGRAGRLRQSR